MSALQGDLIQALNALKQDIDIEPWREQIRNFKAKLDFTCMLKIKAIARLILGHYSTAYLIVNQIMP